MASIKNENGEVESKSYVVISDDLQHNATTYYVFQRRIIQEIKENHPNITRVVYWSDGAGSQYKNFKNMANLRNHKSDYGLDASHNFFASCHGKGPCDAIGGIIKCQLRNAAKAGGIIQNPDEVYDFVLKSKSKIKPFFASAEDVDAVRSLLNLEERYSKAPKIPRIREMHRVVANENSMDLYELSTDETVCCTLTLDDRFDAAETEIGDWVAAVYDESWYFGKIIAIILDHEELEVKFLKTPGNRISTFTNAAYEKNSTDCSILQHNYESFQSKPSEQVTDIVFYLRNQSRSRGKVQPATLVFSWIM